MATAVKEKEITITQTESPVHHMVRALGAETRLTETGDQVYSAEAVNAQVADWLGRGYKLQDTHYLGPITTTGVHGSTIAGYRILYIFVRNGVA